MSLDNRVPHKLMQSTTVPSVEDFRALDSIDRAFLFIFFILIAELYEGCRDKRRSSIKLLLTWGRSPPIPENSCGPSELRLIVLHPAPSPQRLDSCVGPCHLP